MCVCVCVFGYDPNPCTGNPDLNQPAINGMTVLRSLELQQPLEQQAAMLRDAVKTMPCL